MLKFYNITNLEGFLNAVDSCKGKVELVTGEGDRLNLKSKLCQFVSFANIINSVDIPEMEIITEEKDDEIKLLEYMISGSKF